ncbi:hypothetical protein O3M35_004042 [Rhynocoris fuscipes]|uniref:Large ribosomal subunit protein mL40 n=1 Tax=Rhynocoris fuscipes TaxID=488301 RepID=A0AAW1CKY6_9HEMI
MELYNGFWQSIVKRCFHSVTSPLFIKCTDALCAEPLKKKKRLDPAIIKQREERKKRRLEKQIRRLEKNVRQFKPISECEIPLEIINNRKLNQISFRLKLLVL